MATNFNERHCNRVSQTFSREAKKFNVIGGMDSLHALF